MCSKNKSVSSSEKSQGGKDAKGKKDKKEHVEKKDVAVFLYEERGQRAWSHRLPTATEEGLLCQPGN